MAETAAEVKPEYLPATSSEEVRKYLEAKQWLPLVRVREVRSGDLQMGGLRIDADYHTSAAAEARRLLASLGPSTTPLTKLADLWVLPRFKRIYTTDHAKGWPYLGAEESFSFRPRSKGALAKKYTPESRERHFAKEGWLLMTASGSVGEIQYATKLLEPYFLTHDLVRIIPHVKSKEGDPDPIPSGYLCACLSTPTLRSLVIPYGAVVRHIEPSHLSDIPIPRLEPSEEGQLDTMVKKAWGLRDEANKLLDEASQLTEQFIRNRASKAKRITSHKTRS